MPNVKISAAPAVTVTAGTDEYATNQGGVSKRTSLALISAHDDATQADMEAASSTTKHPVVGRQHFHPSAAKCWLACGVTANILASYNITSLADTGTGIVTVTIATDFSSTNWNAQATGEGSSTTVANTRLASTSGKTAGAIVISTYNGAATTALADPTAFHFAGFGDHA